MHIHFDNITSFCNVETVDKILGDSNLIKRICRLCFSIISVSRQGSSKKWCSSGVACAISRREIIDFIGFSGTLQDIAVADEQCLYYV